MYNKILKTRIGFTLIELMIVIAIVALLMVVLVPALGLIKNKSREAGLRENMLMLEGMIHSIIDDYDTTEVADFELRLHNDINSITVDNQKIHNPVTNNPVAGNPSSVLLAAIGTGAVVHDTTDNANNGGGIDAIWTDGTVTLANSAGTIAYAAYINTGVTPNRINVRLIPFGVNNKRITALEKVISQ